MLYAKIGKDWSKVKRIDKGGIYLRLRKWSYLACLCLALITLFLLAGCGGQEATNNGELAIESLADTEGKTIAVVTGTIFDQIVAEKLPGASVKYYKNNADSIAALEKGAVDAMIGDEPVIRNIAAKNPRVKRVAEKVSNDEVGAIFQKGNEQLQQQFNSFIQEIQGNGIYDEMIARWLPEEGAPGSMPDIELTPTNGTLVLATNAELEPFTYYDSNNQIAGFDIEIAKRFAAYMDMDLRIMDADFGGVLNAVQGGKADFGVGLINITPERQESFLFSDSYYDSGSSLGVLDTSYNAGGFWQRLKDGFYQNLIVEDRYKLIFSGLGITMVISIFALLLGTAIGGLICYCKMAKSKVLNKIAKIYLTILRGIPVLVILMLVYYVIFAAVDISAVLTAVIAFGLNTGAYVSEIFHTAISAVDKGQIEAGRSMGFSKFQTFRIVTLPQAIRNALPVYKSEFISLVKSTSIVGYIAIIDLTKASDIIRSKTMAAFFPLILVGLIYLAVTGILIWGFERIEWKTDKRRQRRRATV